MNNTAPIGVFDSGAGGLSVLQAIRAALAYEDLLFVADSAHVPYGEKSPAFIQQRAQILTQFLIGQGAKAIVIACNTATATAAALVRSTFAVPIVGMEPAVKPAAAVTRTGVVGVLATTATLHSATFAALAERYGHTVTILTQACPGLVEQVEAGDLTGPATRKLVERYTAPLLAAGADTLVLGCTHYPFLRPLIVDVVGPAVTIVETGTAVARHLQHVLETHGLLTASTRPGADHFWTSGDPLAARRVFARLWGRPVDVKPLSEP